MKVLKQLFDFYINSSIHVALAVYALSFVTFKKLDLSFDQNLLWFNFYATITGYNFVKYYGLAKWHRRGLASWLKVIQLFSFASFIMLCYYAFKLEFNTLQLILVFGIITFLYAIPFIPKKWYIDTKQNLRGVSGLKVYVIALVWSGVTVVLPIVNSHLLLNEDMVITIFQNFILVVTLMLPFEIRDLSFDSLKLATIPQRIGVRRTKILGLILLLVFYLSEFFKDNLRSDYLIIQMIVCIVIGLFLMFSNQNRNKYYSSFWVEAIPILWMLFMLL